MVLKRALSLVRVWVQMRGAIGSGPVLHFLLGLSPLHANTVRYCKADV